MSISGVQDNFLLSEMGTVMQLTGVSVIHSRKALGIVNHSRNTTHRVDVLHLIAILLSLPCSLQITPQ